MESSWLWMYIEINNGEIIISKVKSFTDKIIDEIEHNLQSVEYNLTMWEINNTLVSNQMIKVEKLLTNHRDIHLQEQKIDQEVISMFFNLTTFDIEKLSLLTIKNNKSMFFIPTLFGRISYTIKTYCKKHMSITIDNIYEEYQNTIKEYQKNYKEANSSVYHQAINKKKIMSLMEWFYIDYSKRSISVIEEHIDDTLEKIYILPISDDAKLLHIEQACLEIATIIIKEWANKHLKDFLLETQKKLFEKSHTERQERRLNEINRNIKKVANNHREKTKGQNSTEHLKKEIPEEIESFFDEIQSSINGKEKDIKNYCIRLYNKGKWIDFDKIQKDYNISQNFIDQYKKEAIEIGIEIYEKPIDNLTNLIKNVLEDNPNKKVHKDSIASQKSYSIEDLDNYSNVSDFLIEVWYTFETKNIENNFNKDRNRWLKSDKALKNEFINKINQWNIWREYCTPEKDAIKFNQGWWKRIYKHNNTNVIFWYAKDHDEHDRNLLQRKKT